MLIDDYARCAFLGSHQSWDLGNNILDNPESELPINLDKDDEKEELIDSRMSQVWGD